MRRWHLGKGLWKGRSEPWGILGNRSRVRKTSMSKGSKAEAHLTYSKNSKEASVAEEWVTRGTGKEVREETRATLYRALQAILIKDLSFLFF